MTPLVATSFADLPGGNTCARIRLSAPRANALEPELLKAMSSALDQAETGKADVILLTTQGRNFCSGGDVARFAQAVNEGRGVDYAEDVVGRLQEVILRLVSMPRIVGVAGRGALTGGGAGFLFAADIAVLSPESFIQPFYTRVGFAPDGGWTALLPDRVGAGRAMSWQMENRAVGGEQAVEMGLAASCHPDPESRLLALFSEINIGAAKATKKLIYDQERLRHLAQRLNAEAKEFRRRIACKDTVEGMTQFLSTDRSSKHA